MVRLVNLTKSFGRVKAVDGISLHIFEGEIFSLLGPSGCGKTTTLRLIAGLEEPDDGEIFFGERCVVSVRNGVFVPPHKRNLGMVFQSYAIWPHMTVFENVAFSLKLRGIATREIRERVAKVLEMVGLSGLENRQGPQLSGGQQQRVALARALVHEPSMLLLDEPFSNLDAKLREQMRVQLKILLKKLRITVVFVTHDQVEALSLSDRTAVISAGHVEQLGSPQSLYERPETSFVRDFLGRTVLLHGTVKGEALPGRVTIELDGISGFSLSAILPDGLLVSKGSKVFVAVRPEEIQLMNADEVAEGSNYLKGIVEALLFVGDHYECRVGLENEEKVLVYAPRTALLHEGESLRLKIPNEGIRIWAT